METIKLNIIIDKDWLEATWSEDEIQVHCESFSGHPEHITMLEAKALEFGTSLDGYAELIEQAKEAFVMPTAEELLAYELDQKIQEAKMYLASTDYKMTVDYFATLTKEIQDELILKRNEAREFIRQGAK